MLQSVWDGLILGIGLGLIILGLIGVFIAVRMLWYDRKGK
jgi:uncharacterized SAM-binding protein YcdF (DUF218 family)